MENDDSFLLDKYKIGISFTIDTLNENISKKKTLNQKILLVDVLSCI